jgi:thiol-disulfide isomerase/thioredoxin
MTIVRNYVLIGVLILASLPVFAQTDKKLLTVGDKAPALAVFRWIKGKGLTTFEKGHAYLIEFGATWCVPCRAAIPHLSALQKRFGDSLQVISLLVMEAKENSKDTAYLSRVRKFVGQQQDKIQYTVGADDPQRTLEQNWLEAANLTGIPHAFLIDGDGKIAWIGNANSEDLEGAISLIQTKHQYSESLTKNVRDNQPTAPYPVNLHKPLYIDNNGGTGDHFIFRSILTKFNNEVSGNYDYVFSGYSTSWSKDLNPVPGMVQQIGAPLEKLYFLAYGDTIGRMVFGRKIDDHQYPDTIAQPQTRDRYGDFWYRAILEVRDTTPFKFSFKSPLNRYNYSLIVPDEKATAAFLQKAMQRDLQTYFGYQASVEIRMMPYWRLVASPEAKRRLRSSNQNGPYTITNSGDTLYHYQCDYEGYPYSLIVSF